ncbi:hypothetical protein ACOSQ3_006577 [Xanthoceras sorbifolium]
MEGNKTFVFAAQGKEVNMEESAKAFECGDTSSKRACSEVEIEDRGKSNPMSFKSTLTSMGGNQDNTVLRDISNAKGNGKTAWDSKKKNKSNCRLPAFFED